MPTTTVTSKGQVTIPKRIRDFLHVKPGDVLDFVIDNEGRVLVKTGSIHVRELEGLLHQPGRRPVPLADIDAAIARGRARNR